MFLKSTLTKLRSITFIFLDTRKILLQNLQYYNEWSAMYVITVINFYLTTGKFIREMSTMRSFWTKWFFGKSWFGEYLCKPLGDEWYMKLFDRTYCINSTQINNTMVQSSTLCLNWDMVQSRPTFTETRFIVNCIFLFLSNVEMIYDK